MSLFDTTDYTLVDTPVEVMSADRRRTQRARAALASGKHPANGLPVDLEHRCGDCVHLNRYDYKSRRYIKCPKHRLGESHSASSDMRASWPACPHFEACTVPEIPGQGDLLS